MIETLHNIIDNTGFPIIASFLLGILMAISPCPLATNITAIAYISKRANALKHALKDGLFYTLGRVIAYTSLSVLIYFGLSSFQIARIFQSWGDKILGPVLIIIALLMLNVIKIKINFTGGKIEKIKNNLLKKSYWGPLLLGILLSLAFCPYSGILFFAILIPMILSLNEGLLLAPIFAIGTGLPVLIFSLIITLSFKKLGRAFNAVKKIELIMRHLVSFIFLAVGIYYSYFLILFLLS